MTKKIDLLLVDDRPENLVALEASLESLELNIVKAISGNDALALMLQHEFALVLMDVQMPEMDGFETAELMRSSAKTKNVPIIFVSASSRKREFLFKGYESGAVDYLLKPIDTFVLKNKVSIFVELFKHKQSLQKTTEDLQQTVKQLEEANRKTLEQRIEIQESESRFKDISFSIADWIWEVDSQGQFTFVSGKVEQILGYSSQELIGKDLFYFMIEDEARRIKKVFTELAAGKKPLEDLENRVLAKDGSDVYFLTNGVPIFDETGELKGYRGVNKDICEQKRAKEVLLKSEATLKKAQELAHVGSWEWNLAEETFEMSEEMNRIYGLPLDRRFNNIQTVIDQSIHPDDRSIICEKAEKISNGISEDTTYRIIRPDGKIRWINSSAPEITKFTKDGKPLVIMGTLKDITEQKQAEDELLKFKMSVEGASDAIGMSTPEGIHFYQNKAFSELLGYNTAEELAHAGGGAAVYKDRIKAKEVFDTVMQGDPWHGEVEMITRDEKNITVLLRANAIKNEKGNIIATYGAHTDITARKQAERELEKAKQEADEMNLLLEKAMEQTNQMALQTEMADMAKSQFLANMSHEIRTPMNGIIGFSEMLLDTDLNEDQSDFVKTIKRSGDSLLGLINDILDFSKIEAKEMRFEEIEFDPELMTHDACELIRQKVASKPIELLCSIGDRVPSTVKGDPTRFRQVLINLLGNAPKFTESGEIELALDVDEEDGERIKLHARVRDTGTGIPEDKLTAIFEPFQQVDGSTTRKYGGTGLGLSICKKISTHMEGDTWAESTPGHGSIFHFTAWLKKSEGKAPEKVIPASLAGKRVLLVDDNQTHLALLTQQLERVNMHVSSLENGKEVLPAIKASIEENKPYDLCIADTQMPEMSGYAVAETIRDFESSLGNQSTPLPLLALSVVVERETIKCNEAGFDAFLAKPVKRERLYQILGKLLGEDEVKEETEKNVKPKIIPHHSVQEDQKHSLRILLAEDNPVNQKLAKMMLTKAGCQVEVANDGKEAVIKYTNAPNDFDLIFMDIQMPEMDGMAATKKIRKWEKTIKINSGSEIRIPIAAMTANAMKGDREACLKSGMDDYISKPIKKELVFKIIEKHIINPDDA